jgi:molybdopterin-guanine dinucleotide biosynthesis protein A
MSVTPTLFGLVLAGGASRRMQQDKATLAYHGRPQLQHAFELVSSVCAASFISVRPDQRDEPTRATLPQIIDRQPGIGPIAGIAAALTQHPKVAWLVGACDLPFLDAATLNHLIAGRDPQRLVTAYRSAHDGLPEPLCAIWEPSAREPLQAFIAADKQCPRKFLINADTLLLDLPSPAALDNVNTPQELDAAHRQLAAAPVESPAPAAAHAIEIRVQYFALFREQAGRSEEAIRTNATTPAALYRELQSQHPFKLAQSQLKVAINNEFAAWDRPLTSGDTLVFIPPVAGG